MDALLYKVDGPVGTYTASLRELLDQTDVPFKKGDRVGIKLHWGERGNNSYLSPDYASEIVNWLKEKGCTPVVFDTTVLYSGGRRTGKDTLVTAASHGYTEEALGCSIVVADGMEGDDVIDIPCSYKHFSGVQVASIVDDLEGFVIFSHFKGHMVAGFGGAVKNISMGFASRAQKQRMHADARPVLRKARCTRCGVCVDVCPTGAARMEGDDFPVYDKQKCIGCAQCIAMCPELALRILFNTDMVVFQEKLVETAAAVWQRIKDRTVLINAIINISAECDCLPGEKEIIAPDIGFLGGRHPVLIDAESIRLVGREPIDKAHPNVPWDRQFEYADEIGF